MSCKEVGGKTSLDLSRLPARQKKKRKQLTNARKIQNHDYVVNNDNSLFYGLPENLIDRLQRVQNSAVRLVMRTSWYESATRHLKAHHLLPVRYRIEFKIAALTYRCIYCLAPSYIAELVNPYLPSRELRSPDSFPKTKQDR